MNVTEVRSLVELKTNIVPDLGEGASSSKPGLGKLEVINERPESG